MRKNGWKHKMLAGILCASLVFQSVSVTAFAEESTQEIQTEMEETVDDTATETDEVEASQQQEIEKASDAMLEQQETEQTSDIMSEEQETEQALTQESSVTEESTSETTDATAENKTESESGTEESSLEQASTETVTEEETATETGEVELKSSDDSGTCGQNLKWQYDSNSETLTISGSGDMNNYEYQKLPSSFKDYVSCPWNDYRNEITKIVVEDGVTSIGNYAFSYCSVLEVELPDSLKKIGNYAFFKSRKLPRITVPDGVTTIGEGAFSRFPIVGEESSLQSVELPDSVTTIGDSAFAYCNSLKEIKIPKKVIKINDNTFTECTSLTSVELPDSLEMIGIYAFSGCTSLASIKIPEKVKRIDQHAFTECTNLTNVELPDSLMDIGSGAFQSCTSLISIIIPQNVTSIANDAFNLYGSSNSQITLIVYKDSAAHDFAINNSFKYKIMATNILLDDIEVGEGQTKELAAKLEPEEASYPDVTGVDVIWESSNSDIASVENGTVTGKKKGTCTVSVICGKLTASCTVMVTEQKYVSDVYTNPVSGSTVEPGTKIELLCDMADAHIYYTTDGSDPTTQGVLYKEKITINENMTIKAIAKKDGCIDSPVAEFHFYVAETPQTEQVSQVYANYSSGKTLYAGTEITLYCDTEGAEIYYTVDGTEPTTKSTHYTRAITLEQDIVIKAIAVRSGYDNSAISVLKFYAIAPQEEEDEVLPEDIPSTGIPNGMWVASIKDQTYTGAAIKPVIHVYEGKKLLEEKKDYTLSYKTNVKVGRAEVVISGKGNYKDKQSAFFNITQKDINDSDVIINDMAFAYNNKSHKTTPVITYNGKKLKLNQDFIVDFGDGDYTQPGTYYATVNGIGNYMGICTKVKTTIADKSRLISKASVIKPSSKEYNDGKEITLSTDELKVVLGNILVKDRDYEVSYINNVNPGQATVVIKGKGDYVGTKQVSFKIVRKPTDIGQAKVSYTQKVSFTKGGCMPEPQVTYNGTILKKGTDYTVSYSKNKKVGEAVLTVKGKGMFKGSKSFPFTIEQKSIENVLVRVSDVLYSDKPNKYQSKPVLTDSDGKVLKNGTDYTIQGYVQNGALLDKKSKPAAGTVIKVKLSGKGNYIGDMEVTYTVKSGINISGAKISVNDKTYTGAEITLSENDFKSATIKIKSNQVNLIYGRDYEIVPHSYENNLKKGTATVVIRGLGQYVGDKTIKFKITGKKIFF